MNDLKFQNNVANPTIPNPDSLTNTQNNSNRQTNFVYIPRNPSSNINQNVNQRNLSSNAKVKKYSSGDYGSPVYQL